MAEGTALVRQEVLGRTTTDLEKTPA
jgi:hypothetical protein